MSDQNRKVQKEAHLGLKKVSRKEMVISPKKNMSQIVRVDGCSQSAECVINEEEKKS